MALSISSILRPWLQHLLKNKVGEGQPGNSYPRGWTTLNTFSSASSSATSVAVFSQETSAPILIPRCYMGAHPPVTSEHCFNLGGGGEEAESMSKQALTDEHHTALLL